MDYFILLVIGCIGLVFLVAGIVILVLGFIKESLGLKVGGSIAILKGLFIVFFVLLNAISMMSMPDV